MRIGIDARTILSPEKGDAIGSGHYTYQLVRHLLEMDKENEYVLFFDFRVREKDVKKFSKDNVKIKFFPFSDYKKYLPGMYNELLGTATLQKENLDILHSTSFTSRIPASYKGKAVVTFNDMEMFEVPQYLPKTRKAREKAVASLMARKARKIIASSESLKKEMERHLGTPEEKIDVIYSGLDERFFEDSEMDSRKILEKYGVTKKYILFLGTLEPSKNITRLLNAFAKIKKDTVNSGKKFEYQLVLAGKKGWLADEYQQMVKDMELTKDVVFTGYMVGDELTPLFKNSEFFIMPSLYEGFGMTVLEAFATKTPSVVSRIPSLVEITGEATHFINPYSTDDISEIMKRMLEDDNFRKSKVEEAYQQARKYKWENTARKTLDIYKEVAGK